MAQSPAQGNAGNCLRCDENDAQMSVFGVHCRKDGVLGRIEMGK
jgi:hypothetical protein